MNHSLTSNQEFKAQSIRYLALGDSYTIGEGVAEDERWPVQFGERLEEKGFHLDRVKIIAQTGWTTADLMEAVENTVADDFNLVSLLIGVNNQYQHLSFENFKLDFNVLIQKSIDLAGSKKRVFVVSIPDYGVTPYGQPRRESIAKEIDNYNGYISEVCQHQEIPFIDITGISRKLADSFGALASDKLHPSGKQYQAWIDEIFPKIFKIIEE